MKQNEKTKRKKNSKKKMLKKMIIAFIIFFIILAISSIIYKEKESEDIFEVISAEIQKQSSIKIKGAQKVDDIEVMNIEVLSKDGETKIFAVAKNNTEKTLGDIDIRVEIMNKNYDVMYAYGYIEKIEPGEQTNISIIFNKEIENITTVEINAIHK